VPYLIDGNNLLGAWTHARADDEGRAEVVRRVAAFCRIRGARAIVVFDGRPLRAEFERQVLGLIEILYPPPGCDADSVIRSIVSRPSTAKNLVVVTSDRSLYSFAKTHGASVLRSHEWNALERRRRYGPPMQRHSVPELDKPEREEDVDFWLSQFEKNAPKRR
jgi:predicted RNA-binding protein with PIN domain